MRCFCSDMALCKKITRKEEATEGGDTPGRAGLLSSSSLGERRDLRFAQKKNTAVVALGEVAMNGQISCLFLLTVRVRI